jgi:drug/metabolite transporter (DMT)-like permease
VVAACGQVLGWLLVARCSPRLPSQTGAILLLFTPVGAVILGAVVLGERPSPWQLAGCVLILGSAVAVSVRR